MNHDLGLTPSVFGFGASIFFLGYMLLGMPSNLVLDRVGARIWIPVILIFWGLVAAAMAFVQGPASFDAVRFLLGIAEAGALPGFALYATLWFPSAYRARAIAGYIIAGQIAAIVGIRLNPGLLDRSSVGPARLAMDVHPRRIALRSARDRLLHFPPTRTPRRRALAQRRTAHLAGTDARGGARRRGRRAAFPARRRGYRRARLKPLISSAVRWFALTGCLIGSPRSSTRWGI